MNGTASRCISCGAAARALGPLPGSNIFAGRRRDDVISGGALYRCETCFLGYRYPRPTKRELDALYASGTAAAWSFENAVARPDWRMAAERIAREAKADSTALDIGCCDGTFLMSLPAGIRKAGIEIMPEGAQLAQRKGIHIVGDDYACLASQVNMYEVITAFDVIEHVEDPVGFIALLERALRPGGVIIVSTGNLDAWSWRLMKNRYWYSAIPEHISFLGERWFRAVAPPVGLEVAAIERYAHAKLPASRKMREAASNLVFLVAPRLVGALRARGIGHLSRMLDDGIRADYPPGWLSAKDHVLVTLRKNAR